MKFKHTYTSLLIILVLVLVAQSSFSQVRLSNVRKKNILLKQDTIRLDTLSIVPNSVEFLNDVNPSSFKIDEVNAQLVVVKPVKLNELSIQYRVYPYNFGQRYTSGSIKKDSLDNEILVVNTSHSQNDELFDFGNLRVEGGLGRSLNFGNNQNLVVNSNLNLRLSGELSNGVKVAGVVTDDNVPFQPQGNSRQIRELDKVFLQFSKNNHQITLGDYEQRKPTSYFLNYNKRLQGINYSGQFFQDKNWKLNGVVSGAVSRGRYAQNQFTGKEGNQGPYKLYGANNETYLIILAGTERVYIDNVLMERGEDRDYIIDYNIGEIIFTNKRFITNRSRISVEFEYTNQNYNSTFVHTEANYGNEKLNFRLNVYTEQDSKNKLNIGDSTLNTNSLFVNIGDQADAFFINNFNEQAYSEDRVQYKIEKNVVVNGVTYDEVFVASQNASDTLYGVSFTYVGAGEGDYELEARLINGRQFKFVGNNQGDYIAKLRVQPPRQQQMLTLTTEFKPTQNQSITVENSFSNKDLNTLSTIGNNDNKGFASRLVWKSNYRLSQKDSLKHRLNTEVNFELKQDDFRSIERYRPVEFSRNWNADLNPTDSLTENYGNVILNYRPNQFHRLNYTLSTFLQDKNYEGLKNFASYNWEQNGYNVQLQYDYLTAKQNQFNSTFSKPRFLVSKQVHKLKGVKIGTWGQENKREFTNNTTGLLDSRSIGDRDVRVFIETADTSKVYTKFSVGKRYDYTPFESNLVDLFETNVVEAEGRLNQVKNHNFSWNLTYRNLLVQNKDLTTDNDKTSFLGRANYIGTLAKGVVRTGFDYQVGAGQEPKREFSFVKVASGEGQYTWVDYNDNGLQEVTEFELAPFSDLGEYVRVFTSSNEYVSATSTEMNQWINLTPAIAWKREKGVKGFLARFDVNSRMILQRKLFEDSPESKFNPYIFNLQNEGLLTVSNRFTNRLMYNKLSNKFRMSYQFNDTDNKTQLLSGFENRGNQQHTFNQQYYLKKKMSFKNELILQNQSFSAENYTNKNFDFNRFYIKPSLNYVVNKQLRLGLGYEYGQSENELNLGGETSNNNAIDFNFNWNKRKQFSLKGKYNFNNIAYNGEENSAVRFSMLNGLQTGRNSIWNLNFEREVAKAVRVNLIYDGRQLGSLDRVHTGRARVTAIFN